MCFRVQKFSFFFPAVPQAKAQLYLRTHMADESKNEYAAQLQNFNGEQWKHFNSAIPQIFKVRHLARSLSTWSSCSRNNAD